jgi:hypothetical protein
LKSIRQHFNKLSEPELATYAFERQKTTFRANTTCDLQLAGPRHQRREFGVSGVAL